MAASGSDCRDALTPVHNGGTNNDSGTSQPSNNGFTPAGLIQQVSCDNSGLIADRFSIDDPLWEEVAKRYQQIIEKECKLLGQFPVYYDGQTIPLKPSVTRKVKTAYSFKEGTTKKDRRNAKEEGKEAAKHNSKEKNTGTCKTSIKEQYVHNGIITEGMEDDNLPKIVEVYSLNSQMNLPSEVTSSQEINGQESAEKGNTQGAFSGSKEATSKLNGVMSRTQTSKNVVHGSNPSTVSSQVKPYLVSDNFIDLTIGDEDEADSSSVHNGAISSDESYFKENKNADNQSEFDQSRENSGDDGSEKKSNQRKRKGVSVGRRRKGKSRRLAQNQQRTINGNPNMGSVKAGCNSNTIIENNTDKNTCVNDHKTNHDKCKQSLNDQNNNDYRKEEVPDKNSKENINEIKEYWSYSNVNGGVHISLDMSYRENKITTLKARLAKQEEELAKLRTHKEVKLAKDRSLESPLQVVKEKQQESPANNLSIRGHDTKETADPVEVNLDDICRHVIKSFDIFNARQGKDKSEKKDGFHTLRENNTCIVKKPNGSKSNLHYQPQGSQEEFLFQFGLRRSLNGT